MPEAVPERLADITLKEYYGFVRLRHRMVLAELDFRYHRSIREVSRDSHSRENSCKFITRTEKQFEKIASSAHPTSQIRIDPPQNVQELWAQHKYSIMARNYNQYKAYGRRMAASTTENFGNVADELTQWLYQGPSKSSLRNALHHMWGYVSEYHKENSNPTELSSAKLLEKIQELSRTHHVDYLLASTALTELALWVNNEEVQSQKM